MLEVGLIALNEKILPLSLCHPVFKNTSPATCLPGRWHRSHRDEYGTEWLPAR